MNWDIIERDSDGFTAVSVDCEVNAAIERMLNKLKLLEIDQTLEELANDTPSLAMHWLVTNARAEIEKGNWAECLAWLNQANCLAFWYKSTTWDKLDRCIGLIYEIDPDVCSYYSWGGLPVVEDKARTLVSVMSLIRPWVELAAKRTRQQNVGFYLRSLANTNWPLRQLICLMRAEFIAAYKSRESVHAIIKNAVGGLW